jgi:hypothetical protein
LAIFDILVGTLTEVFVVSDSPILSLCAHDLETQIVSGHEDGSIIVTDTKSGSTVSKISGQHPPTVLNFINKNLGLIAGQTDG